MHLDDLDQVIAAKNHRNQACKVQHAAKDGHIEITIKYQGETIDPFGTIDPSPVREAISKACKKFIADKEMELLRMGVDFDSAVID